VVLGARPCDAAAVAAVDRVMDWDYHDELWFGRRAATTVVSALCTTPDETCFCTAVGLGPDAGKGSDVLLLPVDGGFLAEVLTDKGEALVAAHTGRFAEPGTRVRPEALVKETRARVAANLDVSMAPIMAWLNANFKAPLWEGIAVRCNGCGACAAVCPTCHCFDIVDEPDGVTHGVRRRNWDTCQTARFTVHASGHNPRDGQNARFRQRVMHKFYIYPNKFGELLCTGCGRCARACPGGQDILETLGAIAALATAKREATV
jgi:ferredoxin